MVSNNMEQLVKDLVLNYFTQINATISKNDGMYEVILPKNNTLVFGNKTLKFTFDSETARKNLCELVSPGSNILFKIVNFHLKNGPVIFSKPRDFMYKNSNESVGIRFYFYILYDGLQNNSFIKSVDVDYYSSKLIDNKHDLIYCDEFSLDIDPDKIDYAYITAIDFVKNSMKEISDKFISTIITSKMKELQNIDNEYQKRLDEIDDKIQHQINDKNVSKNFDVKWNEATAKVVEIRQEQKNVIQSIEKKYEASIDFALFAAQVFPYFK